MDFKKLDQIKTPAAWMDTVLRQADGDFVQPVQKAGNKRRRMRVAAAILVCVLVCGIGVTAAAASSGAFRAVLEKIFGEQKVTEVHLQGGSGQQDTGDAAEQTSDGNAADTVTDRTSGGNAVVDPMPQTPDIPADSRSLIGLKENTMVFGERESFISEYHEEGEALVVDRVYAVLGNGLKELPFQRFEGTYDGEPFSFDYVTNGGEICGFNQKGSVNEIFSYLDGDTAYAALWEAGEDDTAGKGCIAELDLKTQNVKKLSGDNMACNFSMSPNGEVILCNHRADGFWSVFDLASGTEKRVDAISGYNRTDEIEFIDDYHVITLGEPYYKDDMEFYTTYEVDLSSQKVEKEYDGCGELGLRWDYVQNGGVLTISGITDGKSFSVEGVTDAVHPIEVRGEYALFGDLEETDADFYLVNMAKQTWMKLEIPEELKDGLEIHLVQTQKKMLFTGFKEAYLVDISSL